MKLDQMKYKTIDIQTAVDNLSKRKRKLKITTIKFYLKRLSSLFDSAIEPYNIITKSPVSKIEIPKDKG